MYAQACIFVPTMPWQFDQLGNVVVFIELPYGLMDNHITQSKQQASLVHQDKQCTFST
jgi:hypothetical protein